MFIPMKKGIKLGAPEVRLEGCGGCGKNIGTIKYCWMTYLKNIVRNPIKASRFQHSVGVQVPVFYILFVLNIS